MKLKYFLSLQTASNIMKVLRPIYDAENNKVRLCDGRNIVCIDFKYWTSSLIDREPGYVRLW